MWNTSTCGRSAYRWDAAQPIPRNWIRCTLCASERKWNWTTDREPLHLMVMGNLIVVRALGDTNGTNLFISIAQKYDKFRFIANDTTADNWIVVEMSYLTKTMTFSLEHILQAAHSTTAQRHFNLFLFSIFGRTANKSDTQSTDTFSCIFWCRNRPKWIYWNRFFFLSKVCAVRT